jgi:hypothetical protein
MKGVNSRDMHRRLHVSLLMILVFGACTSEPVVQAPEAVTFTIDGRSGEGPDVVMAVTSAVGLEYFQAQRIPVLRGRLFVSDDRPSPLVALINEELAARAFSNMDPIGRRIKPGGPASTSPWMTVIGVVGNGKADGRDPVRPHVYTCALQSK